MLPYLFLVHHAPNPGDHVLDFLWIVNDFFILVAQKWVKYF